MGTRVNVTVRQSAGAVRSPLDEKNIREWLPDDDDGAESLREEAWPSAAARALFGLLRITALVTGVGWWHLLHTFAAFVLCTFAATITVWGFGLSGGNLWKAGLVIEALASTGFFGLMYVLMWLTAIACFVFSRRQFEQQLRTLGRLVSRIPDVSENRKLSGRLRRNLNWLFAIVCGANNHHNSCRVLLYHRWFPPTQARFCSACVTVFHAHGIIPRSISFR